MRFKARWIRKQVYKRKIQKIDSLEDYKLKMSFADGKECGNRDLKDVVQANIKRQLTYEDSRKFRLRAFAHFASMDPLVVYYESGYGLMEKVDPKESFMDLLVSFDDLGNYYKTHVRKTH
jgi:hypothetical protein